jgi:phosphatidylglycerol lysyltransferase
MRQRFTRDALAFAVAAMGAVDLWSALLSHPSDRLLALRHLVPTEVLDTSRTFTLLAGALLLVTAWGLRKGKRRAFVGALLLCAVSVPVNLFKAFDFEEASAATALMFLLGVSGQAFQVKSRELSFGALRSRAVLVVIGLAIYAVGGCWLLEVLYAQSHSLARAVQEAGYQLFGIGSPTLAVPRAHHVVSWYLGSISVLSITVLVGLTLSGLQPAAHRRRHRGESGRVADLLRRHGDNSVGSFALEPGTDYFFSRNGRAVIAYRFESDTLLVIGDPIGPPEEMRPLLEAFAEYCRQRDWQFAFYQARPEHLPEYRQLGWHAIHIGEDPVLWTERFTLEGPHLGALRRNVRKLERDGLEARMFVPGENAFDPADEPDGLLEEMSEISTEWLRGRAGGERGFCMGAFDPDRLAEVWLAVAWNPARRRVEAFCTWVPVWARRGWSIDLMRRRADALSGATEFLIVKSVEAARARGDAMLSLSLSALAKVETPAPAVETAAGEDADAADGTPEPSTVTAPDTDAPALPRGAITDDRAREFLMEHLARFYDFKNLFRWKKKFGPAFEDRYLVYPDALGLPRVARALLRAQSPGGLMAYFRRPT